MEELSYTSKYDGETTDKILDNAKAIMEQTTAEDGETVQVYDTDGVPHKISKTELLKKSTLALPALEDISSFVAVNAAGNAVGVMTKEQVASVLAGLIGINNTWFRDGGIVINPDNCLNNRVYMINISLGTINFDLFTYGNLLYFSQGEYHTQIAMSIYDNKRFTRMSSNGGNSWGEWREF
jgi:hypothetical protein